MNTNLERILEDIALRRNIAYDKANQFKDINIGLFYAGQNDALQEVYSYLLELKSKS
jgi:hypothetical protein